MTITSYPVPACDVGFCCGMQRSMQCSFCLSCCTCVCSFLWDGTTWQREGIRSALDLSCQFGHHQLGGVLFQVSVRLLGLFHGAPWDADEEVHVPNSRV